MKNNTDVTDCFVFRGWGDNFYMPDFLGVNKNLPKLLWGGGGASFQFSDTHDKPDIFVIIFSVYHDKRDIFGPTLWSFKFASVCQLCMSVCLSISQ